MGLFLFVARHMIVPPPHHEVGRLGAVLIALVYVLVATSTRTGSRRFMGLTAEIFWLIQVDVATLGITLLGFWLLRTRFSSYEILGAVATAFFVQVPLRGCLRAAVRLLRRNGRNTKFVVLLGSGPRAEELEKTIQQHPELGLQVVARVPVDRTMELTRLFLDRPVDVLLTVSPIDGPGVRQAVQIAQLHGKEVRMLMGDERSPLYVQATDFFGHPLVMLQSPPSAGVMRPAVKRVFDIVFSGILIVLTSPLLLVAAVAVKLEDPKSPVLFRQERVGLNGRTFSLYKLRTMVPGAEERRDDLEHLNEMDGPVFKIRQDPRITRPGQWIRRFSLDELPQLWNVLLGHMSLVGPRPPLPAEVLLYRDRYRRRLSVRPGITGAWQVSGRNDVGFEEWMELDLQYIDQWSLTLDLQILAKTIPSVLSGRGAS